MPITKLTDVDMFYEVRGEGEPLVLVAGFGADHLAWAEVLDVFAKEYKVIVFDNRGAGQTTVSEGPYTISQLASDIVALCDKLEIKQAHFVGSSMGGFIVQQLAYDHPDLVKSLVIANSAMHSHNIFNIYLQAQLNLLQAKAPISEIIKASCCWLYSYKYLTQPRKLDEIVELTMNNPHPFSLEGYQAQMAALLAFDSREWVGQLTMPVLVLSGAHDIIFNTDMVKALADAISSATYHCFVSSAHLPMIEEPRAFVEVITAFFKL